MSGRYHHGDLLRVLLDEAAEMIIESGPAALSLRELARRAGVSHAAPAHHFKDKRGLFTALAVQGLNQLVDDLRGCATEGFDETAVAYVQFARSHQGHYAVMHRPELLNTADAGLVEARQEAARMLGEGVSTIPSERRSFVTPAEAAQAAWALVHGLASLTAEGAISDLELEQLTRRSARQLFG